MTTSGVTEHPASIPKLIKEFDIELASIADWWIKHSFDHEHGGFYGEIALDNKPRPGAPKSIVLNTRILWFFSEAAIYLHSPGCRAAAERAYDYLLRHFADLEHGGFYWEVDAQGQPLNTKKQVYAQAFTVYALSSYYRLTDKLEALQLAEECFDLIETHTRDSKTGGYLEAFTREWGPLEDVRLSLKDLNFPKSMNTHLHVLEAYTALHQVAPRAETAAALRYCIECFEKHIVDPSTGHLRMFLDHDWNDHSVSFSFGHDIEFSWLLIKALDALEDKPLTERLFPLARKAADVCLAEALGADGELVDAFDLGENRYLTERVWWVQAEALVGFLKIYSRSGESRYFNAAEGVWAFIQNHQKDHEAGEWLWHSTLDADYQNYYKAGAWKCPYHNGRAMIEAGSLLKKLKK